MIGSQVMKTGDITWLVFMLEYGVDGCCTIMHRIMLHENLGEAHRKHAYQLLANELSMSHVTVSLIYFGLQLVISLVMVYLIPDTLVALNVPKGQWHTVKALESGSVIIECKDGPYEPQNPADVLTV